MIKYFVSSYTCPRCQEKWVIFTDEEKGYLALMQESINKILFENHLFTKHELNLKYIKTFKEMGVNRVNQ